MLKTLRKPEELLLYTAFKYQKKVCSLCYLPVIQEHWPVCFPASTEMVNSIRFLFYFFRNLIIDHQFELEVSKKDNLKHASKTLQRPCLGNTNYITVLTGAMMDYLGICLVSVVHGPVLVFQRLLSETIFHLSENDPPKTCGAVKHPVQHVHIEPLSFWLNQLRLIQLSYNLQGCEPPKIVTVNAVKWQGDIRWSSAPGDSAASINISGTAARGDATGRGLTTYTSINRRNQCCPLTTLTNSVSNKCVKLWLGTNPNMNHPLYSPSHESVTWCSRGHPVLMLVIMDVEETQHRRVQTETALQRKFGFRLWCFKSRMPTQIKAGEVKQKRAEEADGKDSVRRNKWRRAQTATRIPDGRRGISSHRSKRKDKKPKCSSASVASNVQPPGSLDVCLCSYIPLPWIHCFWSPLPWQ